MKLSALRNFLFGVVFVAASAFALQSPAAPRTMPKAVVSFPVGRRHALTMVWTATLVAAGAATSSTPAAVALDMDAFVNSELASDTANCNPKQDPKCIPKLTQDEALCKYGQSGEARAEACKRVRSAGGEVAKPNKEKGLGGAYAM